jgi:hypothetical protein
MSKTDQFWQYAKEAMLSACFAETHDDKRGLLELARTWTQAALLERASPVITTARLTLVSHKGASSWWPQFLLVQTEPKGLLVKRGSG